MKKVNRKSAIVESLYITDDGKEYSYRCQAIEHERTLIQNKLNSLETRNIDLNKIGIEITLYLLKTQENIKTLTEYYEINKMRKPDLMVNTYAGFYIYKGKESSITQTEIASFVNDKFEGLL